MASQPAHHPGDIDQNEDSEHSWWIALDERDQYERDRAVNLLRSKLGLEIEDKLASDATHAEVREAVLAALVAAGLHSQDVVGGKAVVVWGPADCPVCARRT